jgi:hypothetical protein
VFEIHRVFRFLECGRLAAALAFALERPVSRKLFGCERKAAASQPHSKVHYSCLPQASSSWVMSFMDKTMDKTGSGFVWLMEMLQEIFSV